MFKKLFRLLLILVVIGALFWFFAPRTFNEAANALINSANSAAAQVQGLAQFVPASVNSKSNTDGNLQVNLSGLTPNATYELHLDKAQCGQLSKSLGQITADASGNFYKEFPLSTLDTRQNWFVDVLQQGQSIACGQLQTDQNASTQLINASQGPDLFSGSPTGGDSPTGLPNTGANPGNNQQYDNNQYPRKY